MLSPRNLSFSLSDAVDTVEGFPSLAGGSSASSAIKQIKTPAALIELESAVENDNADDDNPSRFEWLRINFYDSADVTGFNSSTNRYELSSNSSPLTKWKFNVPNAEDDDYSVFKVRKFVDGNLSGVWTYKYSETDPTQYQWELDKNGVATTTIEKNWNSNRTNLTKTITRRANGSVSEKTRQTYTVQDGQTLLKETVKDPDGNALTTSYTYDAQQRLQEVTRPDGSKKILFLPVVTT